MESSIHNLKMDFTSHTGDGAFSWIKLFRQARRIPGLHYMMWFRFCNLTKGIRIVNRLCEYKLRKVGVRYNFDIPSDTRIGGGYLY